jgi:hypothetical protein
LALFFETGLSLPPLLSGVLRLSGVRFIGQRMEALFQGLQLPPAEQ